MPVEALYDLPLLLFLHADPASVEGETDHGEQGDRVFQHKWEWFVQMNTAQGLSTVPFFSSMRLG